MNNAVGTIPFSQVDMGTTLRNTNTILQGQLRILQDLSKRYSLDEVKLAVVSHGQHDDENVFDTLHALQALLDQYKDFKQTNGS